MENERIFNVPLVWSMCGRLKVKASSREEAIRIALGSEAPLPDDGIYVDDSVMLDDTSEIEEYRNEESGD